MLSLEQLLKLLPTIGLQSTLIKRSFAGQEGKRNLFMPNQEFYKITITQKGDIMETMLIELTNQKAAGLLHEMEELNLIKVLKENKPEPKGKLSAKYRGIISKKQGENLNEHIKQMRSEWNNI